MGESATAVRRRVSAQLAEGGVPTPQVDAGILVASALGTTPAALVLADAPDATQLDAIESMAARRAAREPLQHILGEAHFRTLSLTVGPGVFVPRPETEVLVELALRADLPESLAVDLCAGSGAIALSLAVERPGTRVYAVERDDAAYGWLIRNLARLAPALAAAGSAVTVVNADATADPLPELYRCVGVVTCNPPYIPDAAVPRDPEVAEHDPAVALYGGPDGLDVVRGVVAAAADLLAPGGLLLIEHGDAQGDGQPDGVPAVLATDARYTDVVDHRDLTGRPRVTAARRV